MKFPLAQWIDDHLGVRHNLSISGMRGALRSTADALRRPVPATDDELRVRLARLQRVPAQRLFLTHGASEGNALVTSFLSGRLRRAARRSPRFWTPTPEYPPLRDLPEYHGFRRSRRPSGADLVILSDPNNPQGRRSEALESLRGLRAPPWLLLDQTFREFSTTPTTPEADPLRVFRSGTFTKVYGADYIRVGFVVAPEPLREEFEQFHALSLNELPHASVHSAMALLRDRERILGEARELFRRNHAALRSRVDDVPHLVAPLWFDPVPDSAGVERRALDASILVCQGRYFGDPSGVRLCLTRPSFPEDLDAYLAVRNADRVG